MAENFIKITYYQLIVADAGIIIKNCNRELQLTLSVIYTLQMLSPLPLKKKNKLIEIFLLFAVNKRIFHIQK